MYSHFIYVILMFITSEVYATQSPDTGCVPVALPKSETIGLISKSMGFLGMCTNKEGIEGFKVCRGYCLSGQEFNSETKKFEPHCQCCRVAAYTTMPVVLTCDDGSEAKAQIPIPDKCSCRSSEDAWYPPVPNYKPPVTGKPL